MTRFTAIVAYDSNYGIAKAGTIPWRLPADKYLYKQLIADSVIVRSGKVNDGQDYHTPPRKQIVVSRDRRRAGDYTTVNSVDQLLKAAESDPLVYVCGGQDIYQLLAEEITCVIATEIDADYDCDRFFPAFHGDWQRTVIATFASTAEQPKVELTVYNR